LQTNYVYIIFGVLSGEELLSVIKEVVKLPAIDFVKGYPKGKVAILGLE
jgi:hypothetical protein